MISIHTDNNVDSYEHAMQKKGQKACSFDIDILCLGLQKLTGKGMSIHSIGNSLGVLESISA